MGTEISYLEMSPTTGLRPMVGMYRLPGVDAFALTLLGHPGVAVYDGSLSEWVRDESLPMETGDEGSRG